MKKFDNSSLNPNLKLEIHCRCAERVRDELFRKVRCEPGSSVSPDNSKRYGSAEGGERGLPPTCNPVTTGAKCWHTLCASVIMFVSIAGVGGIHRIRETICNKS